MVWMTFNDHFHTHGVEQVKVAYEYNIHCFWCLVAQIILLVYYIALNSAESIPEQTGPLITPAALPTLNPQQIQQLQMAKKYCQDITNKFVSTLTLLFYLLFNIFNVVYSKGHIL